jgi:Right handed beta helix region
VRRLVLIAVVALAAGAGVVVTLSGGGSPRPLARTVPPGLPPTIQPSAACPSSRSYYVDPTRGSDGDCGTSPGSAWRTVAHVNAVALRPGDRVYFAGGQHVDWGYSGQALTDASLRPRSGVTYASYGAGRAIFDGSSYTDGAGTHHLNAILLCGVHDVRIANLDLDGGSDRANTAIGLLSSERPECGPTTHVVIAGDLIHRWDEGIQAGYADSDWTITNTTVDHTSGNGILFDRHDGGRIAGGRNLDVLYSRITNTGEHPPSGYDVHGIYDNSSDSRIIGNTITNFRTDGVSIRFHGAQVKDNYIAGGQLGIGVYEYDSVGGTSQFTGNTIRRVSSSAIFVCGTGQQCALALDRFVITGNKLDHQLDLQPTAGGYDVSGNSG